MARSLSNAKLLSAFVVDGVSLVVSRRGYATASRGAVTTAVRGGMEVKHHEEAATIKEGSGKTNSWIPDPVTGYYRPENRGAEIDVAELREMLLNQKTRHN